MLKRTSAALLLAATLAVFPAFAQQAQMPPKGHPHQNMAMLHQRLASFRHEPLTVDKAKAAIEIFLTLKEKYPPQTFRGETAGPMGAVEAMKRSEKAREILELIKSKGFADIDQWARTFASVGMALAHVREGENNAEKKLKELEAAPIPEEMKGQIRAMLKAVIPPEQNVEVAKKLLADDEARAMIEQVEKPRGQQAK